MPRKPIITLIPLLAAYALVNVYRPGGLMAYFFPITCWSLTALIILWVGGPQKVRLWFSKPETAMATLIAALQIVSLIFVSLFTSFGRSPYSFTPIGIMINIAYFSSALIALELSRAYLIKSCPKRRIFTGMALTALFYTLIIQSPARFITLTTPVNTIKFIGSELLPTLAQNLLATYLALLGGPTASIAYVGVLEAFEWLSPFLPNPPWAIKALITTLTSAAGFILINETVSPIKLIQTGIIRRSEIRLRKAKSHSLDWLTITILAVIIIWSSTGLLGFQPAIIASGSMQPTLNVGDIAITIQTNPENIQVGDIIQYWRKGEQAPIIHRVIEVYKSEGVTYIITKGDANNAPDEPITATRPMNKVVFVIPKIGWISIYLKSFISQAWTFFVNNAPVAYASLIITLTGSLFGIRKYRNQLSRKIRKMKK